MAFSSPLDTLRHTLVDLGFFGATTLVVIRGTVGSSTWVAPVRTAPASEDLAVSRYRTFSGLSTTSMERDWRVDSKEVGTYAPVLAMLARCDFSPLFLAYVHSVEMSEASSVIGMVDGNGRGNGSMGMVSNRTSIINAALDAVVHLWASLDDRTLAEKFTLEEFIERFADIALVGSMIDIDGSEIYLVEPVDESGKSYKVCDSPGTRRWIRAAQRLDPELVQHFGSEISPGAVRGLKHLGFESLVSESMTREWPRDRQLEHRLRKKVAYSHSPDFELNLKATLILWGQRQGVNGEAPLAAEFSSRTIPSAVWDARVRGERLG